MANENPAATLEFDAVYRGERPPDTNLPFDFAPWDIGEPQPLLVELEREGHLRGEILDAGCGAGENALFLAGQGHHVTGFDFSPAGIEQARERAQAAGVQPEFVVEDATRLDGLAQRFTTVLDSALYHCLPDEQRPLYAAALHRVAQPGAALHLICSADVDQPGIRMPMRETTENLRTHLSEHWDIQAIELRHYTIAITPAFLKSLPAETFDEGYLDVDWDSLSTDDSGRVRMPVWHLHALRR